MSTDTKQSRAPSRKSAGAASRVARGPSWQRLNEMKTGAPAAILVHDLSEMRDLAGKAATLAKPGSAPIRARDLHAPDYRTGREHALKKKAHMLTFVIEPEHRHLEAPLIKAFELFSSVIEKDAPRIQTEKLRRMCQLLIEDIELPGTAVTEARMRADAIRHLMEKGKWLKAVDIAKLGGYSGSNPAAPANRWKKEGKVFAVNFRDQDLFSAYQFSDTMTPRPVIAKVLSIFKDKRDPWKIAAWFASVNSWLGGKRPQDCLDNPDAVIPAATQEIAGFDG